MTTAEAQAELKDIITNCGCSATRTRLQAILNAEKKPKMEDDEEEAKKGYDDDGEGSEVANDMEMHSFDGPKGSGKSQQAGGDGKIDEYQQTARGKSGEMREIEPPKNNAAIDQWLAQSKAPKALRDIISNARRIDHQAKYSLVSRLVANIENDQKRNAVGNRLMRKSLGELEDLALIAPPTNNAQTNGYPMEPQPLFFNNSQGHNGSTGGLVEVPVENEFVTPTLNWAEEANFTPETVRKLQKNR